jgi:hypothetical protein
LTTNFITCFTSYRILFIFTVFEGLQTPDSRVLIEQAKKEAKKEANKWFDKISKKIEGNSLEKQIKIETTTIVSTTIVDSILDYAEDS